MRTVNQATENAWSEISYTKVRVYLPELEMSVDDANIGSISFNEAISDTDNLFFVGCISSELELTLNDFTTDIHLKTIEVYAQKGNTTELKIFKGKVYTADLDGRNNTMKVVAYDSLYRIFNADITEWYGSLEFPMSMKDFRDAFFLHFGITQKAATLLFDNLQIERTIGGEEGNQGILGRDIIKPLCEANVVFGHIDYDGDFVYQSITQNNRNVALGEVNNMVKAKYETSVIDKVIVRTDEEDIGAVSGTGANAYIVEGNMFFLGFDASALEDVADAIFGELSGFSFQPLESEQQYNAIYELGDLITVPDGFGDIFQTIILQRTTDFQRETVISKGLSEYSQSASYTNNSLVALLGKTNRLYRDVEQTRSTITDIAAGLHSEIVQTAEGLEIEIERLQSEIDGEIEYYETTTTPTLTNYPAWDFTSAFKCDGTVKCADIYNSDMTEVEEGETGLYPHFYYTEQDRQDHLRDLVFDRTNALSYRFSYEKDEDDNKIWYWQEIADTETAYILQQISELKVTAEELSSDMTSVEATIGSQGLQIATNTSNITQTASQLSAEVTRATASEGSLSSRITQNATSINAKVSKTGGNNSSFGWSLTDSSFDLYSNGSRVFRCNSSGIQINGNGTFTGNINASGGTIGGWSIANSGISKTNGNKTIRMQSDGTLVCQQGSTILWALQNDGNVQFNGNCTINGYATSATVSALQGDFNTLNAKAITTDNFSAQNINANKITTGTLSTSRLDINGLVLALSGKALSCTSLSANYGYFQSGIYIFENNVQYGFYRRSATIAGQTINFWGW